MISIDGALQHISTQVSNNQKLETITLNLAHNRVLSQDILSQIDMPPFRQSAMDGYAINLHNVAEYQIKGEVKAGDHHQPVLKSGEAVRIFTGAPVPETANAIIIQEHVTVENGVLTAQKLVKETANIRPKGEQIKKQDVALKKGQHLNAAAIGYLASLGVTEVQVYAEPSIAIIVTGNELITPGTPLQYGQIYESNAAMLKATLAKLGYHNVQLYKVKDDYNSTEAMLKAALQRHDVLLVSGGISVGDYDFVGKALLNLEVQQHFYKVHQKPGKPLFFGTQQDTLIFALPGNPASALTCFYIYVCKALALLSGNTRTDLHKVVAKSANRFHKKGDRPQFLKAYYEHPTVTLLDGQSSAMLHTFAQSNALAFLPADVSTVAEGDSIELYLLP